MVLEMDRIRILRDRKEVEGLLADCAERKIQMIYCIDAKFNKIVTIKGFSWWGNKFLVRTNKGVIQIPFDEDTHYTVFDNNQVIFMKDLHSHSFIVL